MELAKNRTKEGKRAGKRSRAGKIYPLVKRAGDIVLSAGGIVVLSPVFAVTVGAVKAEDPGSPVFFVQERAGKGGKGFRFFKFRSMVPGAEEQLEELRELNEKIDGPMFKIANDPRITKVGRVIRKYSIDELPQLINVLKGDMSIVGPRPSLPREVRSFTEYQKQRLSVKPGLTCYWQVRPDRNEMSFDEWVDLDLKYIEDMNLGTDIKIILKTIGTVFRGEGV